MASQDMVKAVYRWKAVSPGWHFEASSKPMDLAYPGSRFGVDGAQVEGCEESVTLRLMLRGTIH